MPVLDLGSAKPGEATPSLATNYRMDKLKSRRGKRDSKKMSLPPPSLPPHGLPVVSSGRGAARVGRAGNEREEGGATARVAYNRTAQIKPA